MQLLLIVLGILVMVMGIYIQIFKPARRGYQLVRLPGYGYVILGIILIIIGVFLG